MLRVKRQNGQATLAITDWRNLIKELDAIDKTQTKQMFKEIKKVSEPLRKEIKGAIPKMNPGGRGMAHGGKTGWGRDYGTTAGKLGSAKRYPADYALSQVFKGNRRGYKSIARVTVKSAGTQIADLAQKPSGKATSRMYEVREFGGPVVKRTHPISSSAVVNWISKLGPKAASKKNKSRFVYPAADKALPQVESAVASVIETTHRQISSNLTKAASK